MLKFKVLIKNENGYFETDDVIEMTWIDDMETVYVTVKNVIGMMRVDGKNVILQQVESL